MAGLSPAHLFLILIIALVVIGPDMLPEAEAAVGKSVREFQEASSGVQESITGTPSQPPSAPVQSSMPSYVDHSGHPAPVHPVPVAPPGPQSSGYAAAQAAPTHAQPRTAIENGTQPPHDD